MTRFSATAQERMWGVKLDGSRFKRSAMWHNVVWIGGAWIVSAIGAWLVCRARGYAVAAWVAPLTISAFCLGLYLGIDNSAKGRFRLPFVHPPHRPHLAHHAGR